MSDFIINQTILKTVKENCQGDEVMWDLLRELLYEIANQEGKQWKDLFLRKVMEAAQKGRAEDEN